MTIEPPDLDEPISFTVDDGAQAGPFSMRSIIDSIRMGDRLPTTLVWWAGQPEWVSFTSVSALMGLLSELPATNQPPPPEATEMPEPEDHEDPVADESTHDDGGAHEGFDDSVEMSDLSEMTDESFAEGEDPVADAVAGLMLAEEIAAEDSDFVVIDGGAAAETADGETADDEPDDDETADAEPADGETGDEWFDPQIEPLDASGTLTTAVVDDIDVEDAPNPGDAEPEAEEGSVADTISTRAIGGLFGAGAGSATASAGLGGLAAADDLAEVADDVDESPLDTEDPSPLSTVNDRLEALGRESPYTVDGEPSDTDDTNGGHDDVDADADDVGSDFDSDFDTEDSFAVGSELDPDDSFAAGSDFDIDFDAPDEFGTTDASAEDSIDHQPEPTPDADEEESPDSDEPVDATPDSAPAEPESDAELDAIFADMVRDSWTHHKQLEFADRLDEVLLGAVINSTLANGFALIDLTSTGRNHALRFANAEAGSQITLGLEHLTPTAAEGEVLGHHARVEIGWGQRVADAAAAHAAVAEELSSGSMGNAEPGSVKVEADAATGFAHTKVDLIWAIEDYVARDYTVDDEALRRSMAAALHALRSYWNGRFTAAD
ncbi:MAG: GYF domain-containing protein [Acidimicrobiales bacterium]